ncbi:MAG: PAS domain-containing sensor histidine kinase, partial [Mycetocola sp.]
MTSLFSSVVRLLSVDQPSPLIKHIPTIIGLSIATLVSLLAPTLPISQPLAFVCSVLVGLLSVVLAVWFTRRGETTSWVLSVPLVALLAIALLRVGTGGATSLFSALIILPVVWIAAEEGRRWILVAGLGTAVAIMMPFLVVGELPDDSVEWVRGIVAPFVFTVVAAVVNEMSRQNRVQLRSIRALAEEQESNLAETLEQTTALHRSEAE